jgi:ankyrin repeat protein
VNSENNAEEFHSVVGMDGRIDLHIAAIAVNTSDLENILSRYSRNINQQDVHGCTPLHYAVCRGKKKMVELLLSYGADPLLRDDNHHTCLDVATEYYLEEILNLLENYIGETQESKDTSFSLSSTQEFWLYSYNSSMKNEKIKIAENVTDKVSISEK